MRDKIADGQYVGTIKRVSAKVSLDLEMEDGRSAGEWYDLASEMGRAFLKKELAKIGIEVNGLRDLIQKGPQAKGMTVSFSLKTKESGYQSLYLEGLAKQDASEAAEDGNDLPFGATEASDNGHDDSLDF